VKGTSRAWVLPVRPVVQAQCGVENHATTSHRGELLDSIFVCMRLAKLKASSSGNLIGADDQGIGEILGRCLGLGDGQAICRFCSGVFAGQRCFIHFPASRPRRGFSGASAVRAGRGEVEARTSFKSLLRFGFHQCLIGCDVIALATQTLITVPLIGACTSFSISCASITSTGSPALTFVPVRQAHPRWRLAWRW